jgi:hypothetical protein
LAWSLALAGFNKGCVKALIGWTDVKFGVPLHANAKKTLWIFNAFNDTVGRVRIHKDWCEYVFHGLMVRAVYWNMCFPDNFVKQCVFFDNDAVPCAIARPGLLVG